MITLRGYEVDDWEKIEDATEPFMPKVAIEDFLERGIAVTGIENGKIMACGGIMYFNNDSGAVWLKASKECLLRPISWAKVIYRTFTIMKKSVGSLDIYTYVLDGFCRGDRLARLIGLEKSDETEEYKGNIHHKYTAVS